MLLIRTSPHICGRWYLPMFLFRDGLLTLMNIDSLISLERIQGYKDNIPHIPSKVGVLESTTFSHTPEEAMSVGLVKVCVV